MEIVIFVALGIVLGFFILANLESILSIGVVLVLVGLGIAIVVGIVIYVSANLEVLIVIPGAALIALPFLIESRRRKKLSDSFQTVCKSTSMSCVAPWLPGADNTLIHEYEKRLFGHPFLVQMYFIGGWVSLDGAGSSQIAERKMKIMQERRHHFTTGDAKLDHGGPLRVFANPNVRAP
jgi:hypothetical protein